MEKHLKNRFLFPICLLAETEFSARILIDTCQMWKTFLRIVRELNQFYLNHEKNIVFLKLVSGHFYGQSFIKTVCPFFTLVWRPFCNSNNG